jgi:tetratricopeptide (TPR) repeat protein
MRTLSLVLLVVAIPFLLGAGSESQSTRSSSKYEKYFNEGAKAQDREKYEEAVKWYRRALNEKPDYPDALNNLGFSLRSIGRTYLLEAGQAYDKALAINENHEGALEYQGELYLGEGRLEDASANLKRLEQLNSSEAKELKERLEQILAEAQKLL